MEDEVLNKKAHEAAKVLIIKYYSDIITDYSDSSIKSFYEYPMIIEAFIMGFNNK